MAFYMANSPYVPRDVEMVVVGNRQHVPFIACKLSFMAWWAQVEADSNLQ